MIKLERSLILVKRYSIEPRDLLKTMDFYLSLKTWVKILGKI